MPDRGGPKDGAEGDFSFARRMLGGMKARTSGDGGPKPAAPGTDQERKGEGGEAGGPTLDGLVQALKQAPGKLSRVEPPGYGHLLLVREGQPLKPGARGDAVEAMQVALRKAGVPDPGWLLGRFDEHTVAALSRFQKDHGVAESGVFGPETQAALHTVLGLDEPPEEAPAAIAPRSGAGKAALPSTGNAFLDRLAPGAVRGMHETGVPASVLLAMSVLESNWGEQVLARDYNNVFALRGEGPAGHVLMSEDGVPAGKGSAFRKYDEPGESVADFARAFAAAPDYQGIMGHRGRAENFARALSGAYSENPSYGSLVLRIMGQFDLARFDRIQAPRDEGW